ncbi:hypothetical protein AVEN_178420-1 [Araneus ventricosus]|uniref:Uncharacterized protein n=1 Tax=Araneus ventricosus TaxID=182803 RepID=A0A4Y2BE46_ARAVE|nr:hypothetical protein AVEN_178420-1 [Araneus ventricosus]
MQPNCKKQNNCPRKTIPFLAILVVKTQLSGEIGKTCTGGIGFSSPRDVFFFLGRKKSRGLWKRQNKKECQDILPQQCNIVSEERDYFTSLDHPAVRQDS